MIKLSPVQFVCAILALVAAQGLALKFLGPDASTVTQLVALAAAAVMRLGPSAERNSEPPPIIATEESKKPDLKVISGGLVLALVLGFAPLACAAFTAQDGADIANHVNALDKCEAEANAVKAEKCADAGPCLAGYEAYQACKKDGGL